MPEQRVKGIGFPIDTCELGQRVPRREAEIYVGMRDMLIRAHCDHACKGPDHTCSGCVTITAKHVTLQCPLCGDRRMTMPELGVLTGGSKQTVIRRAWAMPNRSTFSIAPVRLLIGRYFDPTKTWIDPFVGQSPFRSKCSMSNDLDEAKDASHHMEALDFLMQIPSGTVDGVLFGTVLIRATIYLTQ